MMGFKASRSVAATLAGIEVAQMIRKGQLSQKRFSDFEHFAQLAS